MEKKNKPAVEVGPQRRFAPFAFTRDQGEDASPLTIRGHGSVFNVLSQDLGGFREMIHPGAFDRALSRSDAFCLFNHDANQPLGRQSAGNLTIGTDETGLFYECQMTDTAYARDLQKNIDAKVITQSSFAFTVDWEDDTERKWKFERTDTGEWILHHYEVADLYDVSPVTYPAYKEAGVRTALGVLERAKEAFEARKAKEEQEKADQSQAANEVTIKAAHRARLIQINKNNNF